MVNARPSVFCTAELPETRKVGETKSCVRQIFVTKSCDEKLLCDLKRCDTMRADPDQVGYPDAADQ